ncbi:MAG TPA: response regulator [Verrucomicrobiae bacterium]|nr:response regulator [Verrucomicrobiae bacterium]
MIIDDDEGIRDSLRSLLEKEGYEAVLAAHGGQAMELLFAKEVDLVLLDLDMPLRNGWTTFKELFRWNPALPVFILTGLPHQRDWAEMIGADALVEKPIDVPELLGLMRQALAGPDGNNRPVPNAVFRHVRALNRINPELHRRRNIASAYDHWGLNE